MQLANWGSILSTRELSCGIKLRSIYNKISVELYNPQFMAHQFGVTSHPSLSAEQVKKLTHLTQWLLNLFEFHLFQFDPKKTLNFLNQWPDTMVLFCLMQVDNKPQVELNAKPVASKTSSKLQSSLHLSLVLAKKKRKKLAYITINPPSASPAYFLQVFLPFFYVYLLSFGYHFCFLSQTLN